MKSDKLGSALEYKHLFTHLNAEHIKKIPLLKYRAAYTILLTESVSLLYVRKYTQKSYKY